MEERMRLIPARGRDRWLLVTAAAGLCMAAVATGTVAANAAEDRAPRSAVAGSAAPRPAQSYTDASPAPDPQPENDTTPLGDLIRTGITVKSGEVVMYGQRIDDQALPGSDFGIMAGVQRGSGDPVARVMANEFEGSATAPGFHAVTGAMNVESDDMPVFGYYAGPAAKITARGVTARQAAWSEDPAVIVFWFDPADTKKGFTATGLAAFDAAGKRLPTGNSQAGVG
jgi:hypothetical protein